MAMTMVDCMKKLCQKHNKTIICTIHQPSSEVFEKFDTLCLLAEGKLAYLGPVPDASKHFAAMGFPVPVQFNPSDHYSILYKNCP
jgi:ABC-type multidrug transport system ATPase subunit